MYRFKFIEFKNKKFEDFFLIIIVLRKNIFHIHPNNWKLKMSLKSFKLIK